MKSYRKFIQFIGVFSCLLGINSTVLHSQSIDPIKANDAKNLFSTSLAHKSWASIEEGQGKTIKAFAKAKNDPASMARVKKVAIVSFHMKIRRQQEKHSEGIMGAVQQINELDKIKGELEPFKPSLNQMYETLKQQFEKNGYAVTPIEQIVNNEYYKNLELFKEGEDKAKGEWGGGWGIDAFAYDLKDIRARRVNQIPMKLGMNNQIQGVMTKVKALQELAKALDVDAVVLVSCNAEISYFFGKGKLKFGFKEQGSEGLIIDIYSASEPKEIWSCSLKKSVKWPTNVKSKKAFWIGRGFNKLEEFGPDMNKFIEKYGELAVINIVSNLTK